MLVNVVYAFTVFTLCLHLLKSTAAEVTVECRNNTDYVSEDGATLDPALEEYEAALLLLLGFGGFSISLAILYKFIRRYVFSDVQNVDSAFDAGGNVSASLTAVTVAGQLLWPGDLMQSVTFTTKFGIAGAFWYSAAPLINMSLFPLLSFKFKTRAPGAKTYLQIILTRAGHPTHVVFCFYALLMNAIIMATILVGGIAVMKATIKDVSPEFCLLTIVATCGSYSLIGGLGSTFYVSYFNVLVTFVSLIVLIFKVIYSSDEPFGSLEEIYTRANCMPKVDGNYGGSRFTFMSEDSLIIATQSLFLVSSVTYCDQANWQSRVAAKPLPGAIGILFGAFLWFSVPASIGLVTGITYISETALNETIALSVGQIDSGIVSTYMAQKALGPNGVYMMLIMITMLTMSTGSSEIMGVSSIFVYDIYQTYVNPYRNTSSNKQCILCGKTKRNQDAVNNNRHFDHLDQEDVEMICKCQSVVSCQDCKKDIENMNSSSKFLGKIVQYKCLQHGQFRVYQDSLINVKSWCMVWVGIVMIPYGLFLYIVEVDLNWIMFTGATVLVPSFPGVIMSIVWVKVTALGLVVGSIMGLCSGITANLLTAYLYYEGVGGFILATSSPYAVLAGSGTAGSVSLVVTITVSLLTHKIKTKEDEEDVWQGLRNIDNPLHPWSQQFAEDFPELEGLYRPMSHQLEYLHRHGRLVSIVGFIVFFFIFIILVPGVMTSMEVLSFDQFQSWTTFITIWLVFAASIFIIVTPLEETYNIVKALKAKFSHGNQNQSQNVMTTPEDTNQKSDKHSERRPATPFKNEQYSEKSDKRSQHRPAAPFKNKRYSVKSDKHHSPHRHAAPLENGRYNKAFQDDGEIDPGKVVSTV